MKKTADEIPSIMTDRQLANYLEMSPEWGHQTIKRWAREGKIKGAKVGDFWRFTRQQVEAYLAGGK